MPPKRTSSRASAKSQPKSRNASTSTSQSQSHSQSQSQSQSQSSPSRDSFDDDDLADLPTATTSSTSTGPASAALPPVPSVHPSPLVDSYTWRSPIPSAARGVPCILGVDEAGRGPVLGPLVYGIAYCPTASADKLAPMGFTDSKALTSARRDTLLAALISAGTDSDADGDAQGLGLGWATRTLSPQDISAGMLRRRPVNLNTQSTEATVSLISGVLAAGVQVEDIYVDTVGDPRSYERTLRGYFPQYPAIRWTVTSKADAIYPVVGAASIAAKVTRDRWVEGWRYAEGVGRSPASSPSGPSPAEAEADAGAEPEPEPPNSKKRKRPAAPRVPSASADPHAFWHTFGSGYPGDPSTVSFLQRTLDPVFGWPGVVRFSWATVKTLLEEKVRVGASSTGGAKGSAGRGMRATAGRKAAKVEAAVEEPPAEKDTKPAEEEAALQLTPTGSLPPAVGQPRGYRVKWMDEPASISSFFGGGGGGGAGGKGKVGSMAITGAGAAASASVGAAGAHTQAFWGRCEETLKRERRGLGRELGVGSVGPGGL